MSPADAAREGAAVTLLATTIATTIACTIARDRTRRLLIWAANHLAHKSST